MPLIQLIVLIQFNIHFRHYPHFKTKDVGRSVVSCSTFCLWGRMHDADVSASLRLKLTYDGLAHYVGMQNDVLALVRVLRHVVA